MILMRHKRDSKFENTRFRTCVGIVNPVSILLTQKSIFHDLTFPKMSFDTCHQVAMREQPFNSTIVRNNLIAFCNDFSKILILAVRMWYCLMT